MIRVAAVGDVHVGRDSAGKIRCHLEHLTERADVFLLAGDLTRRGLPEEVDVLLGELGDVPAHVPTFAVLGNHDYESGCDRLVVEHLERAGVRVLEGEAAVVEVAGAQLGIAGAKGFGGGFPGACASEFGEPEMKAFMRYAVASAERLADGLRKISHLDARIALMHYAPVEATLRGERPEIYPFLGSYLLAEAIDAHGADLAIHGHAHAGSERGLTPGGVCVRNVAQPVIRRAYAVFCLDRGGEVSCDTAGMTAGANA